METTDALETPPAPTLSPRLSVGLDRVELVFPESYWDQPGLDLLLPDGRPVLLGQLDTIIGVLLGSLLKQAWQYRHPVTLQ